MIYRRQSSVLYVLCFVSLYVALLLQKLLERKNCSKFSFNLFVTGFLLLLKRWLFKLYMCTEQGFSLKYQ